MKKSSLDYRTRIYEDYGSKFQDSPDTFSEESALRWGRGYKYYFRAWLPLDKNAAIIDVGCGNGKLLYFFKNKGYKNITGVDVSPEQVILAKQVIPYIYEANALKWLENHSATYDLITGLDIVEHFEKPEVLCFLDACFNSLKTGGRLILQTPNAESPWGSTHRYNDFTHEISFNFNALSRLLKLSGFQDIDAHEQGPVPFGHSVQSSLRYILWQVIHVSLKAWNLAETGMSGSGIFTRVFLISGVKR